MAYSEPYFHFISPSSTGKFIPDLTKYEALSNKDEEISREPDVLTNVRVVSNSCMICFELKRSVIRKIEKLHSSSFAIKTRLNGPITVIICIILRQTESIQMTTSFDTQAEIQKEKLRGDGRLRVFDERRDCFTI